MPNKEEPGETCPRCLNDNQHLQEFNGESLCLTCIEDVEEADAYEEYLREEYERYLEGDDDSEGYGMG